MTTPKGPVLIDLESEENDASEHVTPASAPPVPDLGARPQDNAAMARLATMAARPPNRLARWFWGLLTSVVVFFAGLALWSTAASLIAQSPLLGGVAMALLVAFTLVCAAIALREAAAFSRLARLDKIQNEANSAMAEGDVLAARKIALGLGRFYAGRADLRWNRDGFETRVNECFDADAVMHLVETDLLAPLDDAAIAEIESATRQVATITALVPLALADVVAALTANMRMIRRIAEAYGGRSGTLGTWRLTRAVLTHLVATGAVAVGDDLIGSVAGGSLLSRVSRRFGEGVVNGALTARVGVAALEVCRPLPFMVRSRPSVTVLVKRALAGLFSSDTNNAPNEDRESTSP